jgi:ATPase subunit of ABC transporter with duplicated ATPase domains
VDEKQLYADRMQDALDRKKTKMAESIQKNMQLARKQGDDKRMRQAASKKTKLEERVGFERNAKGHRFKLNRDRIGHYATARGDVEHVDGESVQARLRFSIPTPALPRSNGPLLSVEDLCFRQMAKKRTEKAFELRNITFSVDVGQRVAIMGANGNGKSTLLNLLADTWSPTRGAIRRQTQRIGYFEQEIVAQLGYDKHTPLKRMCQKYPTEKEDALWKHLGSFGLGSAQLATRTPLNQMSGGQRVAYAFAELTYSAPSLLLLDEPNGHLDIEALDALANSICSFEGAVVFVSHDVSFVEQIATDYYWLSDGVMEKMETFEQVRKRASKFTSQQC